MKQWKKALLACGALVAIHLCALSWAKAQVRDHIAARGLEWGHQLLQTATLLQQLQLGHEGHASEVQHISLNGAELRLQTGSVKRTAHLGLPDLSATLKAHCRNVGTDVGEEKPIFEAPIIEWLGSDEGFVYCLRPRQRWSVEALQNIFAAFEESLDLTEWGDFQGAYFRASQESIAFVTVETVRGLVPAEMFPARSDAPGENFAELPGPPGRRLLSVGHQGKVALTVHASELEARAALTQYQKGLAARGLSINRAGGPHGGALALVARSKEEAFVVVARPAETGSQMTIARLPH